MLSQCLRDCCMTDFDQLLHAIESAEAEAHSQTAIDAAQASAQREERVRALRARFEQIGIARYLQAQADAMVQQGFHARLHTFEMDDRAHASLEFVPVRGEPYQKHPTFGTNTVDLVILAFDTGDVDVTINARSHRDTIAPGVKIDQLTLTLVQAWFAQFANFAFTYAKAREAGRAPRA